MCKRTGSDVTILFPWNVEKFIDQTKSVAGHHKKSDKGKYWDVHFENSSLRSSKNGFYWNCLIEWNMYLNVMYFL